MATYFLHPIGGFWSWLTAKTLATLNKVDFWYLSFKNQEKGWCQVQCYSKAQMPWSLLSCSQLLCSWNSNWDQGRTLQHLPWARAEEKTICFLSLNLNNFDWLDWLTYWAVDYSLWWRSLHADSIILAHILHAQSLACCLRTICTESWVGHPSSKGKPSALWCRNGQKVTSTAIPWLTTRDYPRNDLEQWLKLQKHLESLNLKDRRRHERTVCPPKSLFTHTVLRELGGLSTSMVCTVQISSSHRTST